MTEERRREQAERMRRRWADPEQRAILTKAVTVACNKEEYRKRLSERVTGFRHSEETNRKNSLLRKGKPLPHLLKLWTPEKRREFAEAQTGDLNHRFGKKPTPEISAKVSASLIKYWSSPSNRIEASRKRVGSKSHFWKGGITPQQQIIRSSIEYRLWREAVFARDNWTCQECKKRGGLFLHAHHIKSFTEYPDLRFAIDNGKTVCEDCHSKIHGRPVITPNRRRARE